MKVDFSLHDFNRNLKKNQFTMRNYWFLVIKCNRIIQNTKEIGNMN